MDGGLIHNIISIFVLYLLGCGESESERPQNPSKFCFFPSAKVLREFREIFAEEFCNFDGRSGLPTLCISAMI